MSGSVAVTARVVDGAVAEAESEPEGANGTSEIGAVEDCLTGSTSGPRRDNRVPRHARLAALSPVRLSRRPRATMTAGWSTAVVDLSIGSRL